MMYATRVLWEGQCLELTEHGDHQHIAQAYYSGTVDRYRRSDPLAEGGVTVQLLKDGEVESEAYLP